MKPYGVLHCQRFRSFHISCVTVAGGDVRQSEQWMKIPSPWAGVTPDVFPPLLGICLSPIAQLCSIKILIMIFFSKLKRQNWSDITWTSLISIRTQDLT